ncbi:hypothetical protein [Kocuria sp. KH4]
MSWTTRREGPAPAGAAGGARRSSGWAAGLDAARGLVLIGLVTAPVLPGAAAAGPGWSPLVLPGHAAAAVALLAGVGLALGSGGRFPHEGRWLAADRVGTAVRAVLVAVLGLGVWALLPEGVPAGGVLVYYAVLCLLAIPFLHLSATALFVGAAVCWVLAPLPVHTLGVLLPVDPSSAPTSAGAGGGPAGSVPRLLLMSTHPALPYLACLLVGLGLGRVRLRDRAVQVRLLVLGAGLVLLELTASALRHAVGGGDRGPGARGTGGDLPATMPVWGAGAWPTDLVEWPAIAAVHTGPLWAVVPGLGAGLLVLGGCLLVSRRSGAWLPALSALGATALTLYTAHLLALSVGLRDDRSFLWYAVPLVAVALVALHWHRALGRGPLEQAVDASVQATRRAVLHRSRRT